MSAVLPLRQRPAVAAGVLVVCCILWGLSFPLMPAMSDRMRIACGDAPVSELALASMLNAWRYLFSAALAILIAVPLWRGLTRAELAIGFGIGAVTAGGMIMQTLGLQWIRPSVSGVITALPIVLAPIVQTLLLRRPVTAIVWMAIPIALGGMIILSQRNPEAVTAGTLAANGPFPYAGEVCTAIGGIFFTAQILAIDRYCGRHHPLRITPILFATVAVVSVIIGVSTGGSPLIGLPAVERLFSDRQWIMLMLILSVFCSVGALTLMSVFQPALSPSIATVLYCMEPVFAAAASLVLGQERLTFITVLGGGLVVGACLMVARANAPAHGAQIALGEAEGTRKDAR